VCDTNPSTDDGDYRRSRLVLTPEAGQAIPRTSDWSYTLSGDNQVDAVEHTVSLYGVDLAGNRTQPLVARYILDNVAPVLTVTAITNTAFYSRSLSVLRGTATDGGAVASVYVLVESGETTYQEPAEREGDTWRYALRPMTPGLYTLRVSAYDTAGNVASSGPFEVAVTAPIFELLYMPIMSQKYTP